MSCIYRLTPDGRKWPPALEGGFYVLRDPKQGKRKHLAENALRVRSEQEAIDLLRRGFSIRVETPTRSSLVRNDIYVDGVKLT